MVGFVVALSLLATPTPAAVYDMQERCGKRIEGAFGLTERTVSIEGGSKIESYQNNFSVERNACFVKKNTVYLDETGHVTSTENIVMDVNTHKVVARIIINTPPNAEVVFCYLDKNECSDAASFDEGIKSYMGE